MSDEIIKRGDKGLKILWAVVSFILFVVLVVYIYGANQNALPG